MVVPFSFWPLLQKLRQHRGGQETPRLGRLQAPSSPSRLVSLPPPTNSDKGRGEVIFLLRVRTAMLMLISREGDIER